MARMSDDSSYVDCQCSQSYAFTKGNQRFASVRPQPNHGCSNHVWLDIPFMP